jgi:dimethylamine/trimethylamine dehydrogenase
MGYDFTHVAVATGARWRADGLGRWHHFPVFDGALTPDDLMAGVRPSGRDVVLFDDEHHYMGGLLAELLATEGFRVTLVTTDSKVSAWTINTMEQVRIHRRLVAAGVTILTDHVVNSHVVDSAGTGHAIVAHTYTGDERQLSCDGLVSVTFRTANDALVDGLVAAGHPHVSAVGDAWNPGMLADAIHHGRLYAEDFDTPPLPEGQVPFRREVVHPTRP